MTPPDRDTPGDRLPTDRESPVGSPVVRGDPDVTGTRADDAVAFDAGSPDDVERAAETVRAFATESDRVEDNVYVLRGAAAAAALVRGEGSYRGAARRAGEDVSVSFVRKWARVHDLPRSVRRAVAAGRLTPSAAKHVARLEGDDRLLLAWAAIDEDLTVREVRSVVSEAAEAEVPAVLDDRGIDFGAVGLDLPAEVYCELRRRAAAEGRPPESVAADALEGALFGE
jgi:hypothetical protein